MTTRSGLFRHVLRPLRIWATFLVVLSLDQISKHWACQHLTRGSIEPLLPGLLQLQRVSNTGAAFSLFARAPAALALVSGLVCVALIVWILVRPPRSPWTSVGVGLLLGGAMGNGLDRWRLGAVVDFLEFVPFHFPIFNIADVAINLAVVCFVIELFRPQTGRHA